MSITLDVNAFLNKDVCTQSVCNDDGTGGSGPSNIIATESHENDILSMEKEMETTNIFEEIEHLLKFNKNLEFPNEPNKQEEKKTKSKKVELPKPAESFNLDFLPHTEDFLLASETQSLLGEDPLLFSVEHDRLQPLSSKFMVPGIYKRIDGIDAHDRNRRQQHKLNVFITSLEKAGRILREQEFERLYELGEIQQHNPLRKQIVAETPNENIATNDIKEELPNNICAEEKEANAEDSLPKDMDNLYRLACDILKLAKRDDIAIDRNNNEVIRTHHRTNQKTIYRFCQPDMLDLKSSEGNSEDCNTMEEVPKEKKNARVGRPRKRLKEDDESLSSSKKPVIKEPAIKQTLNQQKPPNTNMPQTKTRSGRLVRIPSSSLGSISETSSKTSNEESLPNLLNDLRDVSYHNSKVDANLHRSQSTTLSTATESDTTTIDDNPPLTPSPPPKRKVAPEAICPTCQKIFLGKRLQRHFAQHPDHIKVPTAVTPSSDLTSFGNRDTALTQTCSKAPEAEDVSLFRFLVNKLQKSPQLNEDQKADLFLAELNDLVEQLQLRSSRLIRNTSGLHFVNQKCSKLLGIPEGQYALDMTAIESPMEPEPQDNNNSQNLTTSVSANLNSRSLDYTNLSITLDNTITDEAAQKLNLSAGGKLLPPSEESLLRAVDDLLQTDISKIQTTAVCASDTSLVSSNTNTTSVVANLLPPHIDHVSDNAVEAVHMKETLPSVVVSASENPLLDLSVDFFQFNN
uniref:C2H2-type domain-containing protein n=1 Tax=Musca domestica TaxID=7370 RepID=A0A1I8NAD2_MUSDO